MKILAKNQTGCILELTKEEYDAKIERGMKLEIITQPSEAKKNQCEICGKVCKNALGLRSHMRSHKS